MVAIGVPRGESGGATPTARPARTPATRWRRRPARAACNWKKAATIGSATRGDRSPRRRFDRRRAWCDASEARRSFCWRAWRHGDRESGWSVAEATGAIVHGGIDYTEFERLGIDPADVIDFSVNSNPYGPSPV